MSIQAVVRRPSSAEVRAFAVANGLASPGKGRLSNEVIAAFNKDRRGVHRFVRDERVRTHTAKPVKGRAVTRNYRVKDARAWAVSAGLCEPGQRGRMSREILDRYVLEVLSC